MADRFPITEEEILGALHRSGYLFESEIVKTLVGWGYFVESNQITQDHETGKSREIDILAEYYNPDRDGYKVNTAAIIKFIFEVKNNDFPLVLLTKLEFSPNIEIWNGLKIGLNIPENIQYSSNSGFYESLLEYNDENIYTQYCSLNKKKASDQLMASHPENIYSGLLKIAQYCEEQANWWNRRSEIEFDINEQYFRNFLYLPVLLLNNDLYTLDIDSNNSPSLLKADESKLVFNYHHNGEAKLAIIYVVTKRGLLKFLEKMQQVETVVESEMIELKKSQSLK